MKFKMPVIAVLLTASVFQFSSCKKKISTDDSSTSRPSCSSCMMEQSFTGVPGEQVVFHYKGQDIYVTKKGDHYILGGDVVLSPEQVTILNGKVQGNGRTAINSITKIWPNRTIFFTIDAGLPNQWRVTDAIAHWQAVTNLVFVPRTTESNYITFFQGDGCYSNVGMIGGMQVISIGNACGTGNAIHEIGHAVGFYHEHTRSDRDDYITVNFNNIDPQFTDQFRKYTELGWGGLELKEMDFNSIMLYGSYDGSINGLPCMVRRGGTVFAGQRTGLSTGDIDTYNYLYNRPFLDLVQTNMKVVNTPQQRGRTWNYVVRAYTDASRTTPMNLARDLEVHYSVVTESDNHTGFFFFHQGTNSYNLGSGYTLLNLVGHRYTISQEYGLLDLIQ